MSRHAKLNFRSWLHLPWLTNDEIYKIKTVSRPSENSYEKKKEKKRTTRIAIEKLLALLANKHHFSELEGLNLSVFCHLSF